MQTVSVKEIQAAGGLQKWLAREARNPSPPPTVAKNASIATAKPCAVTKNKPSSREQTPVAKGRMPADRLVGYDAERMNKLEAKYAGYLEARRRTGDVVFWRYESLKFRLADRTWYTPDFYIMRADGSLEIHETKGWMQDDAAVKLKTVAEQFPEFAFVLVKWKNGDWRYKSYRGNQ